jgi:hypothetical protein
MRINLNIGAMKLGAVALATVLALTASVMWANPAWAQDNEESAETTMRPREEVRQAGLEAAAEVLGMTPDDLSDQLWGGKTLADLAEEANVPLSDVRAAVEEATSDARQGRIKEFIAKQVEEGRISQERADWIIEGIDNDWFGFGRFAGRFDGLGQDGFGWGRGRAFERMHAQEQADE